MIICVLYTLGIINTTFSIVVKALTNGLGLEKFITFFAVRWHDIVRPRLNALPERSRNKSKI